MNKDYTKIINYIKSIIFILVIICISIFIKLTKISNIEDVKTIILDAGNAAPVIYVLMFSVLPTFFVPVTILAIAAGFVFGFVKASFLTFIAAFINSTVTYFIGKYIAYDFIYDLVNTKYSYFYSQLKETTSGREGFVLMLILRILPFMPYTLLNYMSGVVGYEYFTFISSSMIGIIPGMLAYVNMGASLNGIGSKRFYIAIIIYIVFVIFTTILGKKMYGDKLLKKEDNEREK